MSDQLAKAKLTPYMTGKGRSEQLDSENAIELDFNPESLAIRASSGLQIDRGKRSQQQVESVGRSHTTLSFDAIFDNTRPQERAGRQPNQYFDVRAKTVRIANFLQADIANGQRSPKRVQFLWGHIIFVGLIQYYNEVLDYFTPDGVPLRAKLSITITEQHYRYFAEAEQLASRQRSLQINDANALASINNLDSLFDLSLPGSFGFNADLDLDLRAGVGAGVSAEARIGAELGLNADLGFSANAGINLSPQAAVELFGDAALQAGLNVEMDFGLTLAGSLEAGPPPSASGAPPGPWAPEGPRPGTRAAELAARVSAAHAAGVEVRAPSFAGQFSATPLAPQPSDLSAPATTETQSLTVGQVVATAPMTGVLVHPPVTRLPVRGSPPLAAARFRPPAPAGVFSRRPARDLTQPTGRRPAWERLPADE